MSASIEDVVSVVQQLEESRSAPVVPDIEDKLMEITTADNEAAYEAVTDALDLGVIEKDEGGSGFNRIHLTEAADPDPAGTDNTTGEGAGSTGSNPGSESDKSLEERSLDAFAAAIEFFQDQLDREIPETYDGAPSTPREYYEDVRGWSADTIESKQLGYAPANDVTLLDYLMRQGFDADAIQGSGLFYEDFSPQFSGRYVLPYFDETGVPVYAISRSLNEHDEGHPADPHGKQKYTKVIKTKERSVVDEPIFGAETVDHDTERLLVAGGIADAISLHEAGYSCISPVTTVRFKQKHEQRVVELVDEYDLEAVYMLNDAERPTVDQTELPEGETADSIGDVLTITQHGEGLGGAFGNAEFLHAEGIDTYLVDLPGGDDCLRKLDPDDYIKENWGTIETVLRSARLATEHDGFTEWSSSRSRAVEEAMRTGSYQTSTGYTEDTASTSGGTINHDNDHDNDNTNQSSDYTQLYDLEYTDVSQLSLGDRQNNPFGHHGESEGYFVCAEKNGFVHGYDHKYNVAYNALSHLLCDIGERRADAPNGPLSDWEVFQAWQHAKSNGHLPETDPVPYRALRGVAVEDQVIEQAELIERDSESGTVVDDLTDHEGDTYTALPPETYNDVLEHIEDTYGVAPGREPVEATGEPTAALPFEILDTLDVQEARRYAHKRGIEWATTREARERLRNDIFEVMNHTDKKVIDAPTALGKSYTAATEPWKRRDSTTGHKPVVHTHETKEARDQAAAASNEAGVQYAVLKGRTEACPVAAGEYDPQGRAGEDRVVTIGGTPASAWFETVCDNRGVPFSVAHKHLDTNNDQGADLPCCAGEHEECPAITQWNGLPRDDEGAPAVDVIHCTHQFAHVPSLRSGTNLIFDERPNFSVDLSHEQVRKAISAFLSVANAPVTTFEEFVTRTLNGVTERNDHAHNATKMSVALEHEPDREWYLETPHAHTLAPALSKAVYYALRPPKEDDVDAQDANGRYSSTVPHNPPRLDANASNEDGWNRTWVSVVLDADNTVQTVRDTPDLGAARSIIGLDAHPAVTQWQQNVHPVIETTAVLDSQERALWRRFERGLLTIGVGEATRPFASGEYFDADGSRAFFEALRERYGEAFNTAITANSVEERTSEMLSAVGCEDPRTMHYGEEKSRNDFANENVGALNGSIDPGDDFVLNLLAEAGLNASPERQEGDDGETHRAHGRKFVGPDADKAKELLASVREQHVAQSAGRYARNADDPEDRALVFVRTDAAPPGFLDMQVPGVEWVATDTQREIIVALRDRTSATTRELAEAVGCSKEHARDTLQRLHENDVLSVRENAGDHGAHLYKVLAGRDSPASGEVDLSPPAESGEETTNDAVYSYYTWSLAVCSVIQSGSITAQDESTESTAGEDQPPETSLQQTGLGAFDATGPPG